MTSENKDERLDRLLNDWSQHCVEHNVYGSQSDASRREQIKAAVMSQLAEREPVVMATGRAVESSRWYAATIGVMGFAACLVFVLLSSMRLREREGQQSWLIGKVQASERAHAGVLFAKYAEVFGESFTGYSETNAEIQIAISDLGDSEVIQPRLIKLSFVERRSNQVTLVSACSVLVSANEETLRAKAHLAGKPVMFELWTHQLPDGKTLVDIQCNSLPTQNANFSRQFLTDEMGEVHPLACWESGESSICLLQSSVPLGDVI